MKVLLTVSAVFAFLLSVLFNAFTVQAQNWPATATMFSNSYLSLSAPVLTVSSDNSTLYMAYQGTNLGIYIASTTNVIDWPLNPTMIPGEATNSGSSPALIGFKSKMVVAFRSSGSNQIRTGVSNDGVNWNSISYLPDTFSVLRPRFTIANSTLYLYYQGSDAGIYFATSDDGSNWGSPTKIPGWATSYAPALIEFKGKFVLACRSSGSNQIVTGVSTDGGQTFPSINYLPGFYQSLTGLVLATYGDNLYLLWQDPSGAMYYSISSDGVTWPNTITRVIPTGGTNLPPALQEFKGQLVLACLSTGSRNLYLAYTSS